MWPDRQLRLRSTSASAAENLALLRAGDAAGSEIRQRLPLAHHGLFFDSYLAFGDGDLHGAAVEAHRELGAYRNDAFVVGVDDERAGRVFRYLEEGFAA
jgi:hypothetical protein